MHCGRWNTLEVLLDFSLELLAGVEDSNSSICKSSESSKIFLNSIVAYSFRIEISTFKWIWSLPTYQTASTIIDSTQFSKMFKRLISVPTKTYS